MVHAKPPGSLRPAELGAARDPGLALHALGTRTLGLRLLFVTWRLKPLTLPVVDEELNLLVSDASEIWLVSIISIALKHIWDQIVRDGMKYDETTNQIQSGILLNNMP